MATFIKGDPANDAASRVWMLRCNGLPAGSYTDHCQRDFNAGDMLRDDLDHRRQVIALSSPGELTLEVSEPDVSPDPD